MLSHSYGLNDGLLPLGDLNSSASTTVKPSLHSSQKLSRPFVLFLHHRCILSETLSPLALGCFTIPKPIHSVLLTTHGLIVYLPPRHLEKWGIFALVSVLFWLYGVHFASVVLEALRKELVSRETDMTLYLCLDEERTGGVLLVATNFLLTTLKKSSTIRIFH